jgi:hypothetical protein
MIVHRLLGVKPIESITKNAWIAVTEPPMSLGPPTVVLVQRTSDNLAGAPESLDKFGICFPYLSQKRFTHHADITIHWRYENAEAITITYLILKVRKSWIITDQKQI